MDSLKDLEPDPQELEVEPEPDSVEITLNLEDEAGSYEVVLDTKDV